MQRRGKDLEKLKAVVRFLLSGDRLDPIHRDHKLVGEFRGRRERHVEFDYLLV